ncbi:MAG: prepilin-type N-terminal cleavage/methylation domain-containing protein [Candidatus Gribaldobacteria bacterium]|nr:prepilin-type N-terminal cleavage/methylation domain-containing protein [Candidatus Gribaldobacteria bacterium]
MQKGFTLIELLIVIAIIGILSAFTFLQYGDAVKKSRYSRAQTELSSIARGILMYSIDHKNNFPLDVSRDLPPGLDHYMSIENSWPRAAWPESVFDWDNWIDPSTGQPIYQISIRFCPLNPVGSIDFCKFPDEAWAKDFDYYSAAYWCIQGACRSHISKPIDHPGWCINCYH